MRGKTGTQRRGATSHEVVQGARAWHRSTDASVCPPRSSTPPGRATSGSMWPGRLKSSALNCGSLSSRTVRARSAAEAPVVVPIAASHETVNGVWFLSPLSATMAGRRSSAARSRVMGTHKRPLVCSTMKAHAAAVANCAANTRSPSSSRASSSTTTTNSPAASAAAAAGTVDHGGAGADMVRARIPRPAEGLSRGPGVWSAWPA